MHLLWRWRRYDRSLRRRRIKNKPMGEIILKDAYILTMNSPNELPKRRSVIINNYKISKIVTSFDPKNHKNAKIIDCRDQLLLPSFKNGHSHVAMHFLKKVAVQDNLRDWLDFVLPYEKELTEDDIYVLSLYGLMELARNGYSYTFDMYYHSATYATACIDLGFRSDILLTPSSDDSLLKELIKDYTSIRNVDELISPRLGIHGLYTSDPLIVKKVAKLVSNKFQPFYTHLGEIEWENEDSLAKYNLRPVAFLYKNGCFVNGGAIFHGSHLDKSDIEILKKKSVSVITCPQSNLQLNTGLPTYKALIDAKVNIGIGTDGGASNKYLDPFNEMRIIRDKFREEGIEMPNLSYNILKMTNQNVMIAMKKRNLSKISYGQIADLVLIDLHGDYDFSSDAYLDRLIERGSKDDILMTMINGKIVYINKTFPQIQDRIGEIHENVKHIRTRILKKKL